MDFAVVLGDVEVDRPGPELVDHLVVGGVEFVVACSLSFEQRVLGGVVAQQVEIGVGEVGLEAERFGHADGFEQVEHVLPTVHAGPADFALGGEAFAVVGGDAGGLAEGVGDLLGVGGGVVPPLVDAELGGVDADDAVLAHAVVVEDLGDAAGGSNGVEELLPGLRRRPWRSRRPCRARPARRASRLEAALLDAVGDASQVVVAGVGIGVGEEEEVVDAVEFLAVDLGGGGQVEHAGRDRAAAPGRRPSPLPTRPGHMAL